MEDEPPAHPAPTLQQMAAEAQPKIAAELDALGYPAALRDLMVPENIDDAILRHAVFQRGCYPEDIAGGEVRPRADWQHRGQVAAVARLHPRNSDIPF